MLSNMPRVAIQQMCYAFRKKLNISSSHWVMIHRIAILSSVEPTWFHCCPNSCMAYTGEYSDLQCCQFCKEPRLNSAKKPRRLFCYLPLIPRLQGFFMNPKKLNNCFIARITTLSLVQFLMSLMASTTGSFELRRSLLMARSYLIAIFPANMTLHWGFVLIHISFLTGGGKDHLQHPF